MNKNMTEAEQNKKSAIEKLSKNSFYDLTPEELKTLTGISDHKLMKALLLQLSTSFLRTQNVKEKGVENAIDMAQSMLVELAPQNMLQSMLATQMISTHNLQLYCAGKAERELTHMALSKTFSQLALKLSNTFVNQASTYNKLKDDYQHTEVEQVNVHSGGKAVVGNVTINKARKNNEKN